MLFVSSFVGIYLCVYWLEIYFKAYSSWSSKQLRTCQRWPQTSALPSSRMAPDTQAQGEDLSLWFPRRNVAKGWGSFLGTQGKYFPCYFHLEITKLYKKESKLLKTHRESKGGFDLHELIFGKEADWEKIHNMICPSQLKSKVLILKHPVVSEGSSPWQGEFWTLKKRSDMGADLSFYIVQEAVSFTVFVKKGGEVTSQF